MILSTDCMAALHLKNAITHFRLSVSWQANIIHCPQGAFLQYSFDQHAKIFDQSSSIDFIYHA
jgi:hypothetical protein